MLGQEMNLNHSDAFWPGFMLLCPISLPPPQHPQKYDAHPWHDLPYFALASTLLLGRFGAMLHPTHGSSLLFDVLAALGQR